MNQTGLEESGILPPGGAEGLHPTIEPAGPGGRDTKPARFERKPAQERPPELGIVQPWDGPADAILEIKNPRQFDPRTLTLPHPQGHNARMFRDGGRVLVQTMYGVIPVRVSGFQDDRWRVRSAFPAFFGEFLVFDADVRLPMATGIAKFVRLRLP